VNWQIEASVELSIAAVQTQTGLSARTIRYWEELGLLPSIRRRTAGRRVYGKDELERLAFIQRLKSMGLSLQEIKDLNAVYGIAGSTHDMLRRLDTLLEKHEQEVVSRLTELESLQDEIGRYRARVAQRIQGGAPKSSKEKRV
jgi:DNA-binding transcriptional MerR regulator